ncbi:hypothetical protein GCK72_020677 [Caenorhabditis remanei]|uniref:DUF268 domain-containing protein n=1 Tax=Caenorhabditis remanei TaxID=31234 RepID=A0A6A5GI56_CAERE|nr:hypothetical protein GCK72_020677 [Caenorhabditis remanei]KAF1754119.1 hypothetical protein GCK72_020677 [Caenorhabditis remanei]
MTATLYIQNEIRPSYISSRIRINKQSGQNLKEVYKKFGYEIVEPTLPVPILRMIEEPTCEEVFSDWQTISEQPQPEFPPKQILVEQQKEFLLNNYSALYPVVSMYNAMKFHRLDEKNGVVIGSMQPWVEISALVNGAAKILTVEYNELDIQDEFQYRMSSILPIELVKDWQAYESKFDFAASFSSIEHSGLGRYGDPIDPIGDIREVLKIKCMLKQGGLLFIGFPLGTDAIYYNAHRIYGAVRLAMLFNGFEFLGIFNGSSEMPKNLTSERLQSKGDFKFSQNTIVLRKL